VRQYAFVERSGRGGNAEPTAIVVDELQNVYVTGKSYRIGTGWDYATVKYNGSGKKLWVARYNGPENRDDEPAALAVDPSGNVYVTGRSQGAGYDFLTVKYDRGGRELWTARHNGSAGLDDAAGYIRIDDAGNVYVAGRSAESGSGDECLTIKYDAAGSPLWTARYGGSGTRNDCATGLSLDAAGNVYVGSAAGCEKTCLNSVTIKYNAAGVEQWVLPDGMYASRLAVDEEGSLYKAGTGSVWAYDPNRNRRWTRTVEGNSVAEMALGQSGNVYLAGKDAGPEGIVTSKVDGAGDVQWVSRFGAPVEAEDSPAALAVDKQGNVYVAGTTPTSGTEGAFRTVKYDQAGNLVWAVRYAKRGREEAQVKGVAVDGHGNVYVTGEGAMGGFLTIKYSQGGNLIQNPGFELGTEPWAFHTTGTGTYGNDGTDDGGSKAARVAVAAPGSVIQLYQSDILVLPETRYRLKFQAYSSSGNDVVLNLIKHQDPFVNLGLNWGFDLGTGWVNYSYDFVTSAFGETQANARLQIALSGFAQVGDEYYFDDFSLEELGPANDEDGGFVITGLSEESMPEQIALLGNYPNPFNPTTVIRYQLPTAADVRLSVYDLLGREVAVLAEGVREAGVHNVQFDAAGLSSGVYFYRMRAGEVVQTRKLQILR
jgi:hypothetical protein